MTRVVQVEDDGERQRIDRLLRALITEPSGAPMLPRADEVAAGFDSLVLGAYQGDVLVGGLWGGDPYTEPLIDPSIAAWPPASQRLLVSSFVMLHHVAVGEAHRRGGVARQMVGQLVAWAKGRGRVAVYGVIDPAAAGFYEAAGFKVAGREDAIFLRVGLQTFYFPMLGESRWFAKDLVGGLGLRGGVRFGPPPAGLG